MLGCCGWTDGNQAGKACVNSCQRSMYVKGANTLSASCVALTCIGM